MITGGATGIVTRLPGGWRANRGTNRPASALVAWSFWQRWQVLAAAPAPLASLDAKALGNALKNLKAQVGEKRDDE